MVKKSLLLALIVAAFLLIQCDVIWDSLFGPDEPREVTYAVTSSTADVSVSIVASDKTGQVYSVWAETNWNSSFVVEPKDQPLVVILSAKNYGPASSSITVSISVDGTTVDSDTAAYTKSAVATTTVD
ncbi:MAG: hypothetical protein KAU17_13735 [Spirochaetales bacterium]|nr:hypothetical protein [Spirochaetales bacterium]